MRQFNIFLLKYGAYIHTVLLISLLIYIEIGPKSPIFWAFLLNHIIFTYFVIIRAAAFGIKQGIFEKRVMVEPLLYKGEDFGKTEIGRPAPLG